MSSQIPGPEPERPPGDALTLVLWLLAILLAVLELIWLWADRAFSA
jgi:hypothetical protein